MTDRELMQQALDALEDACGGRCNAENNPCWQRDVANALRERLAQPEQDEVLKIAEALRQIGLTLVRTGSGFRVMDLGKIEAKGAVQPEQSLYTAPPRREWVGLTDEDVMELFTNLVVLKQDYKDPVDAFKAICVASDAKLREKNA